MASSFTCTPCRTQSPMVFKPGCPGCRIRMSTLGRNEAAGLSKHCRYCTRPAKLLRLGEEGYPYRRDFGPTWTCLPCQAWVGCHPHTERALGGLANAELRAAKQAAHAAFDPLWQRKMEREQCSKGVARRAGYRWLSQQLGIPFERTHIGYMSLDECRKVVEVCKAVSQST